MRFLVGGAQIGTQLGMLDQQPGSDAGDEREDHHPEPVIGQEHEAEIHTAGNGVLIGYAGGTELLAHKAFQHQHHGIGGQQAVEVVEVLQRAKDQTFHRHAEDSDDDGRDKQRAPIGQAKRCQQIQATKAPSMYCAPWAKFTTFIRPKMMASPMDSMA